MTIRRRASIGFCAATVDAKVFTTILQCLGDSHACTWVRSRPRDDGNSDRDVVRGGAGLRYQTDATPSLGEALADRRERNHFSKVSRAAALRKLLQGGRCDRGPPTLRASLSSGGRLWFGGR
jgi:hypothetical protein